MTVEFYKLNQAVALIVALTLVECGFFAGAD